MHIGRDASTGTARIPSFYHPLDGTVDGGVGSCILDAIRATCDHIHWSKTPVRDPCVACTSPVGRPSAANSSTTTAGWSSMSSNRTIMNVVRDPDREQRLSGICIVCRD